MMTDQSDNEPAIETGYFGGGKQLKALRAEHPDD